MHYHLQGPEEGVENLNPIEVTWEHLAAGQECNYLKWQSKFLTEHENST